MPGNHHGQRSSAVAPKTVSSAASIDRILPSPPNSATKRPPGRSAAAIDCTAASAFFTQCSAAFENTASNDSSNRKLAASAKTNLRFG